MRWWLLNNAVNPVVGALLDSPLHRVMSTHVLLLTYEGIKSGERISVPVGYERDGDTLILTPGLAEQKQWWRNFGEAQSVEVLVGGESRHGTAVLRRTGDEIHVDVTLE